jgi:primosomal replication protein N
MSAGDINELTIAGHVEQPPRMHRDEDGRDVCEFLLSHVSCEHSEYGQWELQHYAVAIYGQPAWEFVETYQPGELIVIAGRLDSQEHAISVWLWKRLGGARRMRPHEYTHIGHRIRVIEPLASIIAHTITTTGSHVDHNQAQLPV